MDGIGGGSRGWDRDRAPSASPATWRSVSSQAAQSSCEPAPRPAKTPPSRAIVEQVPPWNPISPALSRSIRTHAGPSDHQVGIADACGRLRGPSWCRNRFGPGRLLGGCSTVLLAEDSPPQPSTGGRWVIGRGCRRRTRQERGGRGAGARTPNPGRREQHVSQPAPSSRSCLLATPSPNPKPLPLNHASRCPLGVL